MLYVFRVDIGETYIFETDLAFQDVKTLKAAIENEHGITSSKQILVISGGELLDDDAVQVCMKTRETCAGTEENPIYLLDKSHLERPRPLQISLTSGNVPILENSTLEQWLTMPPTYETIVQRADTAQKFNEYAQKIVHHCERIVREQQAQYQGWMAVIANIEDTLSSFLLNRNSFDRLYQSYLADRASYLELFDSLPRAIDLLHRLKLPHKLINFLDSSIGISHKSNISSSTSSSISSAVTTSTSFPAHNENTATITPGEISLFEWITAQLANMKVDDIINGCMHVIDECTEELSVSMNQEIDDLSKKISNNDLKHMSGIEERFALLQNELINAQGLQREQKDCAEYLVSQRQRFSSNIGNQRDSTLIRDISGIHSQNLTEIGKRHTKLLDIERKIRKSKQDIIDQLHRRFKNMMLLQRHLVDYDAKQSLYMHKLGRTRKTMLFLKQLRQAPETYYAFLHECIRRKQYAQLFNQFSETMAREAKNVHSEEVTRREQFLKQYEPHFLFNLLPGLKIVPAFFIKEPLPLLDTTLPDLSFMELNELFEQFPDIKTQNSALTVVDPTLNLLALVQCIQSFLEPEQSITTPLSVLIPATPIVAMGETAKQPISPTNSSSRSTVVRSQSSSDVESGTGPLTRPSSTQDQTEEAAENTLVVQSVEEEESPFEKQEETNDKSPNINESEVVSSIDNPPSETSPTSGTTTTTSNNEEEDDYIQCSLETVYTSTEMAVSPPHRPSASQQTDNGQIRAIKTQFLQLKQDYMEAMKLQHELITNYQETLLKVVTSLQQANQEHKEQSEQLRADIVNYLQDNETLKIQYDVSDQLQQEFRLKYDLIQNDFNEFRRQSDIETSQIVKALQSDFEFELEKLRCEHQDLIQRMKFEQEKNRIETTSIDIQTERQETFDKQTSMILIQENENQFTQTNLIEFNDKFVQTSLIENETTIMDETMRRSVNKEQQMIFNLAIQRAVQNATGGHKKQIGELEQQLADKRIKIGKLKECIKKLQNFYTFTASASSPPPALPSSMMTSSISDEQSTPFVTSTIKQESEEETPDETTTNRSAFLRRSEPIAMPSSFVAQSMLAAGNNGSTPRIDQHATTMTTHNLLMDNCFKSSPSESSAAVELYTPFAASPPNPVTLAAPLPPAPVALMATSPPSLSPSSRVTAPVPQASPIAFFTVNRSDRVIIYFDPTYQQYMVYTLLPTLHFIHSDCYDILNIQPKQNPSQSQTDTVRTNASVDSVSGENGNNLSSPPSLINTSMSTSTLLNSPGFAPSNTPLFGQVTDKEYCQAKKPNNRFNVPLSTKFYRVRVKPWKPTLSSSPTSS